MHLIFDGKKNNNLIPLSRQLCSIRVTFSPGDKSADDYLVELLYLQYANYKKITLVTSDKALIEKASHLGIKTLSSEKFIQFIHKKENQLEKGIEEKNVLSIIKQPIDWLNIFNERFKNYEKEL